MIFQLRDVNFHAFKELKNNPPKKKKLIIVLPTLSQFTILKFWKESTKNNNFNVSLIKKKTFKKNVSRKFDKKFF
jgi:hypothetical protein